MEMAERQEDKFWDGDNADCTGHTGFYARPDDRTAVGFFTNSRSVAGRFRAGSQRNKKRYDSENYNHLNKTEKEMTSLVKPWFNVKIDLARVLKFLKIVK
jgi:hypothetical protein